MVTEGSETARWFVFVNQEVLGPFPSSQLSRIDGFGPRTLVCQEDRRGALPGNWKPADEFPPLKGLIRAPKPPGLADELRFWRGGPGEESALKRKLVEKLVRVEQRLERIEHRLDALEEEGKSPMLLSEMDALRMRVERLERGADD